MMNSKAHLDFIKLVNKKRRQMFWSIRAGDGNLTLIGYLLIR